MASNSYCVTIESIDFLGDYERLWQAHDANSFFRSPSYISLVRQLTTSQLCFAVARNGNDSIASIPFAIKDGRFGPVLNSLPFFGTYGGVVGDARPDISAALVHGILDFAKTINACAATFVEDWRAPSFHGLDAPRFTTIRTNEYVDLAALAGRDAMDTYHQKTRNMVRKAVKSGVATRQSDDFSEIAALREVHSRNMAAVGGLSKPDAFFAAIPDGFKRHAVGSLYIASHDDVDCAFLLLYTCGDTVEYYMPAILEEYRSLQPLSLLIHVAISDAAAAGHKFWNFGGTWQSQHNLRRFKQRWGSKEAEYRYQTYVLNDQILAAEADSIRDEYLGFFVVPFEALPQSSGGVRK